MKHLYIDDLVLIGVADEEPVAQHFVKLIKTALRDK